MADKDQEFRESIYRLAARVKGQPLTGQEQSRIIDAFNNSQGTAEQRAIRSVEEIIGPISPSQRRILEKSAEASANLERLLADMTNKAKEWAARSKT